MADFDWTPYRSSGYGPARDGNHCHPTSSGPAAHDGDFTWVRIRAVNGVDQIRLRCDACARVFGATYPRRNFQLGEYEAMPVIEDRTPTQPPCVRCGKFGTELHHWAPRGIFNDADMWPQSYLCRDCHTHWHTTINAK